jgi:hypothetical protein
MKTRPSRGAFLAFPLIVAGILFGENRLIGYGLMGAGILLAFIDIVVRYKNRAKPNNLPFFLSPVVILTLSAILNQH